MRLILGSQSPRRREILGYFQMPFEQVPASIDETAICFQGDPESYVAEIAQQKAERLAPRFPDALILTADTIVFLNGKVYGKPCDEAAAFQALSELAGNWHTVYTALCLRQNEQEHYAVEATRVLFNPLTPTQIRHYIAHLPWQDKAGGYAIQMQGGLMIHKIEGCYYNVMGLPINTLEKLLRHYQIELWDYL